MIRRRHRWHQSDDILTEFCAEHECTVDRACFGVAGPVRAGASKTPNLPWLVQADSLSRGLSASVTLC